MPYDIVAVMITCDRSPKPNYLQDTVEALIDSDLLQSKRLFRLVISDQSPPFAYHVTGKFNTLEKVSVRSRYIKMTPNHHVAQALLDAVSQMSKWVLFLEDDITVGPGFFSSVGAWLDDHADDRVFYPLAATWPDVLQRHIDGYTCCEFPVDQYYGTQGFVINSNHVQSLSEYLIQHQYDRTEDGTAWDLLISDWHRCNWPAVTTFLTPAPSFVQHIGRESIVRSRPITHTFESFDPSYCYIGRST